MNEVILITLWILAVVTLIVITVKWWRREFYSDDYLEEDKYIFDDFYNLSKGSRDENLW